MSIKLKDLLKENYSGAVLGGVVSGTGFHDNISLSKIVKEKYGDIEEEKVDIEGLTTEISSTSTNLSFISLDIKLAISIGFFLLCLANNIAILVDISANWSLGGNSTVK